MDSWQEIALCSCVWGPTDWESCFPTHRWSPEWTERSQNRPHNKSCGWFLFDSHFLYDYIPFGLTGRAMKAGSSLVNSLRNCENYRWETFVLPSCPFSFPPKVMIMSTHWIPSSNQYYDQTKGPKSHFHKQYRSISYCPCIHWLYWTGTEWALEWTRFHLIRWQKTGDSIEDRFPIDLHRLRNETEKYNLYRDPRRTGGCPCPYTAYETFPLRSSLARRLRAPELAHTTMGSISWSGVLMAGPADGIPSWPLVDKKRTIESTIDCCPCNRESGSYRSWPCALRSCLWTRCKHSYSPASTRFYRNV